MKTTRTFLILLVLLTAACSGEKAPTSRASAADQYADEEPQGPTNRINIPPAVRANLGMTFATIERRSIAATLSLTGSVGRLRGAKRVYAATSDASVDLKVREYQRVSAGEVLATLRPVRTGEDQAALLALQQQLETSATELVVFDAATKLLDQQTLRLQFRSRDLVTLKTAREARVTALRLSIEEATLRLRHLEDANHEGGGLMLELLAAQEKIADLRTEQRAAEEVVAESELEISDNQRRISELANEKEARAPSRDAMLQRQSQQTTALDLMRRSLARNWGLGDEVAVEDLLNLQPVNLLAEEGGVVTGLFAASGERIGQDAPILEVTDLSAVVIRAYLPLRQLGEIASATRVEVRLGSSDQAWLTAELQAGYRVEEATRLAELLLIPERFEAWMLEGAAVEVRIATASASEVLAIPVDCLIRDGLSSIFFVRDPEDPDVVIREEADLGISDGHYVEVRSGVLAGYEVVRDGLYELKLSGQGAATAGGHFHSDGTFHAGAHEE